MNFLAHMTLSQFGPFELINVCWFALALFWIVTSLGVKQKAKAESSTERWTHLSFLIAGALLLFKSDWPWAFLQARLYPDVVWIQWTGAGLTLAGVLFAIWARISLGRNWSAEVQIKQDHQLIRTGPYNYIRHPIYTGVLLGLLGNTVAIGEVRGALAYVVIVIGFIRKAKKEEMFLAGQFGSAFKEHRRRTGFFLPRFS
ncbi:MAG: isoprenylcysteine carboxylmethyltransferase family protein [Candidatus Acidiferrales bacterium]